MQLSIPKPCSEKYENFQATEKGGFCQSCQFEVVDFSRMSSEEIKDYFIHQAGKKVCGRFKPEQLSPPAPLSPPRSRISSGLFLALSVFSVAPLFPALAQGEPTEQQATSGDEIPSSESQKDSIATIRGRVSDNLNEYLPFVNVLVERNGNFITGATTDFDGLFALSVNLQKGDIIKLQFVGFKTIEYTVTKVESFYNFKMEEAEALLGEVIILGEVDSEVRYRAKPSFWNRLKNIFREDPE